MNQVLGGDAFQIISKYLEPMEIVAMCKIYPRHWSRIYNVFKENIIDMIDGFFKKYFGNDYELFRNLMIKNKVVVSGSFILQAIYNVEWEDSDIDFYIPIKDIDLVSAHVFTELEKFFREKVNHIVILHYNGLIVYSATIGTGIKIVRNYQKEMKLQSILVDIEPNFDTIKKYIYSNFDFNICANIFYYDTDGIHLNFKKIDDVINQTTEFKLQRLSNYPLKRYSKYKDRGIVFHPDPEAVFNIVVNEAKISNHWYSRDINMPLYELFEGYLQENPFDKVKDTYEIDDPADLLDSDYPFFDPHSSIKVLIKRRHYSDCHYSFCPAKICKPNRKHIHGTGMQISRSYRQDHIIFLNDI